MAVATLPLASFGVGDRLRVAREGKGRSLRQVADRAGIGRSSLSRWERGLSVPSKKDLDRLLLVLGIEGAEVFSVNLNLQSGKDSERSFRFRRRLLRAIRMRSALSLALAADRVGVSKVTLSRWEAGDRWPGCSRLAEVARALGATEREIEAIGSHDPVGSFVAIDAASGKDRIEALRGEITTGRLRDLDLDFLGLDESLSRSREIRDERLRLELRAAYIEWLGWWYREEEAGRLACKLIGRLERDPGAAVWGRILRAAANYHGEIKRDPFTSLDLLEFASRRLDRHPSHGFVLREISGFMLGSDETDSAREILRRARDSCSGEESQETHLYCCEMIEASLWSAAGKHHQAIGKLPGATTLDPYLSVASAVGRARILETAGLVDEARSQLTSALSDVSSQGLLHFARGLTRRLDRLQ